MFLTLKKTILLQKTTRKIKPKVIKNKIQDVCKWNSESGNGRCWGVIMKILAYIKIYQLLQSSLVLILVHDLCWLNPNNQYSRVQATDYSKMWWRGQGYTERVGTCKPPDLDQTRLSFMRDVSHLFDNALHRFLCLLQPSPQLVQFYVSCHKSQLFTHLRLASLTSGKSWISLLDSFPP